MLKTVCEKSRTASAVLVAIVLAVSALSKPAAANPLSADWTGLYFGLHGGVSWAEVDMDNISGLDATRASLGGHAGYNIAIGGLVLGIEADASHAGSSLTVSTAGGGAVTIENDWQGSVRGRLGVVAGPALLYGTAGWAWTGTSVFERTGVVAGQKADATFNGVVYGIGAESFVLPGISLRLEALRFDYGTERLSFSDGVQAVRDIDLGDTVVRAGVTIHFR